MASRRLPRRGRTSLESCILCERRLTVCFCEASFHRILAGIFLCFLWLYFFCYRALWASRVESRWWWRGVATPRCLLPICQHDNTNHLHPHRVLRRIYPTRVSSTVFAFDHSSTSKPLTFEGTSETPPTVLLITDQSPPRWRDPGKGTGSDLRGYPPSILLVFVFQTQRVIACVAPHRWSD